MEQRTAVRADIEHTQDSSLCPHHTSHKPPSCPALSHRVTCLSACLPACLSMLEMSEQPAYPALSPGQAGTSR